MPGSFPIRLMAHMVAGYPDMATSREVAAGLIEGGAAFLEIQFPYSDPTADGPAIEQASNSALENGFRVNDGFELVRQISSQGPPVFVMSYAGLVFSRGVDRFLHEAAEAGAAGVIVPDLMPGYDEGLFDAAARNNIAAVPVVAPSVTPARLEEILAVKSPFLYAAIRTGITGVRSSIDGSVEAFLGRLRSPNRTLIAGFGISDYSQAAQLQRHADVLVVGTALVRAVATAHAKGADVRRAAITRIHEITGRAGRVEEEEAAH